MKKQIAALILALVSATAFASSDITIINPSNKSSPTTVFAMGIKEAVDGKFYQSSTCEDAQKTYDKTPNAVFIYNSSMEFGARNKGINCPLKGNATIANTIFVGQTYMWICRKPGSTADFKNGENKLGMASMYATKAHEQTFRDVGSNLTIIPYGGSKDVVNAVRAGDISLGWIGSGMAKKQAEAGALDCVYSTDPHAKNFLGNAVNVPIPNFSIGYVVYTNSKDPVVLEKLRNIEKDPKFQKYMEDSLTSGTWKPTQTDLDAMMAKVDNMAKHWIDKK